jgi:hypothetical protein
MITMGASYRRAGNWDISWGLCTISWSLLALTRMGMGAAIYASPNEGEYEFIPDD